MPPRVSPAVSGELANRAYAAQLAFSQLIGKGTEPSEADFAEIDAIGKEPGGYLALQIALERINAALFGERRHEPIIEVTPAERKAIRRRLTRLVVGHRLASVYRGALRPTRSPALAARGTSREAGRSRSRVTRAGPRSADDPHESDEPPPLTRSGGLRSLRAFPRFLPSRPWGGTGAQGGS